MTLATPAQRPFRRPLLGALALLALAGCEPPEEVAEVEPAVEAGTPAEVASPADVELNDWSVRLDRAGEDPAGFQMITSETGMQVTTGPAGIAWNPTHLVEQGDYRVSARFTQLQAPEDHREAYGLLIGGRHLESPDQVYTYFLVRGDGQYLIKRREGDQTTDLVGWTASPAISSAEGADNPNTLTVEVAGEDVRFLANGQVLETLPASEVQPWGIAGVRVNHRLDVAIDDWTFEASGVQPGATAAAGAS